MDDAPKSPRPSRLIPILLALMVLAQGAIANEIRYQGCVARLYDVALAGEAAAVDDARLRFDCSRVPLL